MAYYDNAPSHKPQGKKSFGREKWVEEGSEYRGARHGGRPSGKRDDNRAYGEKKSFGDRKPYGEKKSFGDREPYERRDRYDRRPEMADERPAPSYRDSEYRPVAVAPVMAQPSTWGRKVRATVSTSGNSGMVIPVCGWRCVQ